MTDARNFSNYLSKISTDATQGLFDCAKELGNGPDGLEQAYRTELGATRRVVEDTLELEREWLNDWKEQARNTPQLGRALDSAVVIAESALEARAQLWKACFDTAENVPLKSVENWLLPLQGPKAVFQSWQRFTEQTSGSKPAAESAEKEHAGEAPAGGSGKPGARHRAANT
ncbi:MAG TPA: hypothetical protein VKA32_05135 [Gammaproteobacteria bacterium]|nr:hypothetical protein [Gammaproteobacteria bacterium]